MNSNNKLNGGYILLIIILLISAGFSISAFTMIVNKKQSKENMSREKSEKSTPQYYVLKCGGKSKPKMYGPCGPNNCQNYCKDASGDEECIVDSNKDWLNKYSQFCNPHNKGDLSDYWGRVLCKKIPRFKGNEYCKSKVLHLPELENLISNWYGWTYVKNYASTGSSFEATYQYLRELIGYNR